MNCIKKFVLQSCAAILLFAALHTSMPIAGVTDNSGDIQIISSDHRGITFRYTPGKPQTFIIPLEGGQSVLYRFRNTEPSGLPGQLSIPVRKVLVGLPARSSPLVTVSDVRSQIFRNIKLAPIPEIINDTNGMPVYRYFYEKSPGIKESVSPEVFAVSGKTSVIDGLTVAEVFIYPLKYNGAESTVECIEEMTVRVDFAGSRFPSPDSVNLQWNFIRPSPVLSTLLNYDHARTFSRESKPAPKPLTNVPFADKQWLKVYVEAEGVYSISYNDLLSNGFNPSGIHPDEIRMYYGGGKMLEEDIMQSDELTFREIAIKIVGGSDGSFDPTDRILFYGESLNRFIYEPELERYHFHHHLYTNRNCYFLTFDSTGEPKRMAVLDGTPPDEDTYLVETYRRRIHEERDNRQEYEDPQGNSGKYWFWESVQQATRRYTFMAYNPVPQDSVVAGIGVINHKSHANVDLRASLNGGVIKYVRPYGSGKISSYIYFSQTVNSGANVLSILEHQSRKELIDWYEIEYTASFRAMANRLNFDLPGSAITMKFNIKNVTSPDMLIIDRSDPFDAAFIENARHGTDINELSFQISGSDMIRREFLVIPSPSILTPVGYDSKEPSSLRDTGNGAQHIIITHELFIAEAEELADWRSRDPAGAISSMVVNVQDIYDEFSCGVFDPVAIRDFVRYAREYYSPRVEYVLLIGDGHNDYRRLLGTTFPQLIPPYNNGKVCTDDFYGIVDSTGYQNVAVGRLSVQNKAEARNLVDKIIMYEQQPLIGPWMNRVLLIADDEKSSGGFGVDPTFVEDTEHLSEGDPLLQTPTVLPRRLNRIKLYLTEYERKGGQKPGATRDFIKWINKGVLAVNYVGHGNLEVLAHEWLFRASRDLPLLKNGRKLPLLFLASCSTSHFDHPVVQSLGERLLTLLDGGSNAIIGGTRWTYAQPNYNLNRMFWDFLFDENNPQQRLGLAFIKAKALVSDRKNASNFILMGDPAARLAYPPLGIVISQVDTMRALDHLTVTGQITDGTQLREDFDGQVFFQVFDTMARTVYIPKNGIPMRYLLPGPTLFRGFMPVTDGTFTATFPVPKDISYGGLFGRISAYIYNDTEHGSGNIDSIYVGGTNPDASTDNEGPSITINFEGQNFTDGDYIPAEPLLRTVISDPSGINLTGEVGHDIKLTIDRKTDHTLTEYFVAQDTFITGIVEYTITGLDEGDHLLEVKAWDIHNNSNRIRVLCKVTGGSNRGFVLVDLLCYPNPMRDGETTFTFQMSDPATVVLKIYSQAGRLVDTIHTQGQRGFNRIPWRSKKTLANGVYFFHVSARGASGKKASATEKLLIMRN